MTGAQLGSQKLTFNPQTLVGGRFKVPIKTAGAISLIIQAILPILVHCSKDSQVIITGGTDVQWAPPIDYIHHILFPVLHKMGVRTELELSQRGHYPRGGGLIKLAVKAPIKLVPLSETSVSSLKQIRGISHCVKLPSHVAIRQAEAAEKELKQQGIDVSDLDISVESYPKTEDPHLGPGSGITLWGEYENSFRVGGDALGARGIRAERVGQNAAQRLGAELQAQVPIDIHMADMLLPWAVMTDGETTFLTRPLSSHSRTGIELAHILTTRRIQVHEKDPNVIVACS
jgi:RNA 3'-terminal phosphate cyclase (ATP)